MKPKTIEEQVEYLYKHLAEQIQYGFGDLEDFTDGRGGFISPIVFVESFIERDLIAENAKMATQLIGECRSLLCGVQEHGWSDTQKEIAQVLINRLMEQQWIVE